MKRFLFILFLFILFIPLSALQISEVEYTSGGEIRIEIDNPGNAFDLTGYKINGSVINGGTVIDTASLLVITNSEVGTSLAEVVLPGEGSVQLQSPSDTVLDSLTYGYSGSAPDILKGYSIARVGTSGADAMDWTVDITPTMGSANDAIAPLLTGGIVINEVNPHPGNSFIELYNDSAAPVDIAGYQIVVDSVYEISAGASISAYSYYMIEESSYPASFGLTDFILSAPNGQLHNNVYLYDSTWARVDQIGWETACPGSYNSLQRDDSDAPGWEYDGYDIFTSELICADDSKGFYNVPDCNYDTTAPDWAVAGISNIAVASNYYQVDASWDAAADTENQVLYDVFRSVGDTLSFVLVADDIAATTYSDTAVTVSTTYYYRVNAVNCFGLETAATDNNYAIASGYTLQDLRANNSLGIPSHLNEHVTDIYGTVNVASGVFQDGMFSIHIQDNNYGINVFGYDPASPVDKYQPGDRVKVKGQIIAYNGTTEIKLGSQGDIEKVGTASLSPLDVDIATADWESLEGVLVRVTGTVQNMYVPGDYGWFYVAPANPYGGGNSIQVYWSSFDNTAIDPSDISDGMNAQATGVIVQYDKTAPYFSGYELKPRSNADIHVMPQTDYSEEGVFPSVFYPNGGGDLKVVFNAPQSSNITVRVYDIKGRVQRTLFDGDIGSTEIEYDCKDESGQTLKPGAYIVNIAIMNGLEVERKNFPLVVALPLE
ncbi:lamin tail domain-containing protein [bacterium]|nr:lamin tail domain-containing protein [bacterium]